MNTSEMINDAINHLEEFDGEGCDFTLYEVAQYLFAEYGVQSSVAGDSLVVGGTTVPMVKTGWLEMGHEYSIAGQWSIEA